MIALIDPKSAPALRQATWVNYLEPIHYMQPAQAAQFIDSARSILAVPWAWGYAGTQGAGATITIIDSGVDSVHLASASGDGSANLAVCAYDAAIAAGCYSGLATPHGALVSGVFAARNNCCEAVGVSYGGTVNSIRAANAYGSYPDDAVAAALDWASASGIQRHVVNLSIGGCDNGSVLHEAVARANATGILVVASAGNTDRTCPGGTQPGATGVMFPGAYAEVLTVSGTVNNDTFHTGSRYGPEVDISAPFKVYSTGPGGTWNYFSGTSLSAPVVSGVAALIWSQNPTWSASQVRARLLASAVDLGADGPDVYFGAGRVSAQNAVQPAFVANIAGPQTISSAGTYTWSASASGPQSPYGVTWSYRNSGSSSWVSAGSGANFSRSISATTPSFTLRATATSSTWQGSTKQLYSVWVVIDGGCNPLCEE